MQRSFRNVVTQRLYHVGVKVSNFFGEVSDEANAGNIMPRRAAWEAPRFANIHEECSVETLGIHIMTKDVSQ